MASRDKREILRGVAEGVLDLMFEAVSSRKWAELLKAPLERASSRGDEGLAQKLMEAGAAMGCALHEAAEGGHGRVMNRLLAKAAPIIDKDTQRSTSLDMAARFAALDMAARADRREVLRGLEEGVLDLIFEVFSSERWAELLKAPLERASSRGDQVLAQKLVEAGAEMGYALHQAAGGGHGYIVDKLLESGAPVNDKDTNGLYTPLEMAARAGHAEIVRSLLREGAEKDSFALYFAAGSGHMAATKALLDAGADVGIRCGEHDEEMAHHIAADAGHVDVLRALLDHGADVDAGTGDGLTALHLSACRGRLEMIDVLVEAGGNVQARDVSGRTPLHDAAALSTHEVVLTLLKYGAKVNAKTKEEETPLYYAACKAGKQGVAQVVDVLLRWGADEKTVNESGHTPADVIGIYSEEERLADDVDCVQKLLANAPTDRAWRRRGYLTMCRAHPDRLQLGEINQPVAGLATRSTGTSTSGGGGEEATVDESRARGGWEAVAAGLLRLHEEGLFRKIAGYL